MPRRDQQRALAALLFVLLSTMSLQLWQECGRSDSSFLLKQSLTVTVYPEMWRGAETASPALPNDSICSVHQCAESVGHWDFHCASLRMRKALTAANPAVTRVAYLLCLLFTFSCEGTGGRRQDCQTLFFVPGIKKESSLCLCR